MAAAAAGVALLGASSAGAFPGLVVVEAPRAAANALHDGTAGTTGLAGALRQGPALSDPRWPAPWRVGSVRASALASLDADGMAAALGRAWRSARVGDLVAVDALGGGRWTTDRLAELARALAGLGADARRVVVRVAPDLVAAVGTAAPDRPLDARLDALVTAVKLAGAAQLDMTTADGAPLDRRRLALFATRWTSRLGPVAASRLHLALGSGNAADQRTAWSRARASAAGRELLGNGPVARGPRTAAAGRAWLAAYRAFLAAPDAVPVGGDVPVATAAGLTVARRGQRGLLVGLSRPGSVAVSVALIGGGPSRAVGRVRGPAGLQALRLPASLAPGRYHVVALATGPGLRDSVMVPVTVAAPLAAGVSGAPPGRASGEAVEPARTRGDLLARVAALDARVRPLVRPARACRGAAARAAARLRVEAVRGAAILTSPALEAREGVLAGVLRRLEGALAPCAAGAAPSPPATSSATPSVVTPGVPQLAAIRLADLVRGVEVAIPGGADAPLAPADIRPVDLAELPGPACRAAGAVCLGIDRGVLDAGLRDLANRGLLSVTLENLLTLNLAGVVTQLAALLGGGDLAGLIGVQRVGDHAIRLVPTGPLAALTTLPGTPALVVGQLQAVPAIAVPLGGGVPVATTAAAGSAPAEQRLVGAVNRARAQRGLRPLRASGALARPARAHSTRVALRRALVQAAAGGAPFWTRLVTAGLTPARAGGENVALVPGCDPAGADRAVQLWLAGAGARANLLSTRFTRIGAGVASRGDCASTAYTADLGG